MSVKIKTNPASPNPSPKREWVSYETSRYLAELLQDYKLTTDVYKLWEKLERILLATQRNTAKDATKAAVCEAIDLVLTDLKMFADQGKLDLEYIKTLPPAP